MWVIQFYLSYYNLYLPLTLALASGCSFVARGFTGEIDHLADLIQKGIQHNGFALIDILKTCVSFNRVNTFSGIPKAFAELLETFR
jgi:2-oxoglutarate ferredoxin oxidoreductase subunit beta